MKRYSFETSFSGVGTFFRKESGVVELIISNSFTASSVELDRKQLENMIEIAQIALENIDD